MDLGDLNKVWEVKALKKPGEDEARKTLEKIAKQVQPIMRRRKWKVKVLREFCPTNPSLLGLNVGGGVEVKLRLRRPNRDCDFFPYEQVLDTMLHELCHIKHGPHNAVFYKLWDELRKECDDLISRGITGTGEGFDLPGRRLGGFSHQPPLPSLRQVALAAAEKRARLGSLLPSGPKRLGGDSDIMSALSPIQAAAMAAERRMHDDIWCGSNSSVIFVDDEPCSSVCVEASGLAGSKSHSLSGNGTTNIISKRKSCELDGSFRREEGGNCSANDPSKPSLKPYNESRSAKSAASSSSSSPTGNSFENNVMQDAATWECAICTLINQPMALACEACAVQKPRDPGTKFKFWSCKFCTFENDSKLDNCSACGSWRYSLGPPVSTRAPNHGT